MNFSLLHRGSGLKAGKLKNLPRVNRFDLVNLLPQR